ncbi:MAG: cysteine synthase A [Bacillota bacterium]
MIYENAMELVGNTPLIKLSRVSGDYNIYAKLESWNPGGSVKDRIALNMVQEAEKEGTLQPGSTIVEPTSGNTGIGLALVAALKDYDIVLVMPESVSNERKKLLKAYGADVILTDKEEGMKGSMEKARSLVAENEDYFMPSQFSNPANPEAHRKYTAREIISDLDEVAALVVGVGTGGTLTGTGSVLKQEFPAIKVFAVEPEDSPVISGGEPGSHMIQGIGAGFIPEILKQDIIDEVIKIGNQKAYQTMLGIAQTEGLMVGLSSGANVAAALQVAEKIEKGKNIVTFLPDTGERYLSVHSAFEI